MNKGKRSGRERRKTLLLAREYEGRGFSVAVEPQGERLPEFLRELRFRPDLIVEAPGESIVVEVTSRESVDRLRELSVVSERIEREPGWRFMLVMTNPRSPREPEFPVPLAQLGDLRDAVRRVERLHEQFRSGETGYEHAVLLLAWSVVEGILRVYLYTGKGNNAQARSGQSLVRDAVMLGFVELEDGEFLDRMAPVRNRIVHGVVSERVSGPDLDRLVRMCRSLI